MAINVNFKAGLASAYTAATKDAYTFYYTTDDSQLYLGEIKLSNAADIAAALTRITSAEADIDNLESAVGTINSLTTTAKTSLVAAINEVVSSVSSNKTAATVTVTSSSSDSYSAVYTIKQGSTTVGTINIPKDMVVESGTVEVNPTGQDAGTYLVLTLANATSDKVYINVGTLVDIYTAAGSATQVQLAINSTTREISATLVDGGVTAAKLASNAVTTAKIADGNVTLAKLATAVQTSLGLADSAVQTIATGSSNGTIAVDGTNVSVKGLGSAAYKTAGSASGNVPVNGSALGTTANVPVVTNASGQLIPHASGALGTAAFAATTAFDAAGAASTVQTALDSYKTSNDAAVAAIKSTSDGAVQSVVTGSTNGTLAVDGTDVSVKGLGSAAYKTAGSASGNVPVTGAALGTTANVPVVTNTSGALIPHASGALGTAAFKAATAFETAGAAATVQSALDSYKTSNDTALAAVKSTADSAVQSVTTGTSNGTLAVDGTDVSVKGLGSAAYKTAGSASGNVPVTGAALGTTANVPVVTNTSGALIPHASGALGTAAFKATSAFDAAGAADTALTNAKAYADSLVSSATLVWGTI